jgi:hypothetical protein
MTKRIGASLAAAVLILLPAVARAGQDHQRSNSEKSAKKMVTISGVIASDGKAFLCDRSNKVWSVSNPDVLRAIAGRHVLVHARIDRENGTIRVTSVELVPEATYHARMDDAAFRR